MPRLAPFRGVRYDRTVPLDHVIAPPYDVITADQREQLASSHPSNAVLVELPQSPDRGGDPYRHAAELIGTWERRGILRTDDRPSLYLYRMEGPDGSATTGVIGALALPAATGNGAHAKGAEGSDEIRPHEETLPKPLGDRLDLLRATRMNLSPIWVLSPAAGLSSLLVVDDPPTATATDADGVRHMLWTISDDARVERICETVASAPAVVADGHHRLETALHYRGEDKGDGSTAGAERGEAEGAAGPGEAQSGDDAASGGGAGAVMALVVELSPEQLRVGAIHRLLSGLPDGTVALDAFRERFDAVRAGPSTDAVATALEASGNLGLITSDGVWLLSERGSEPDDSLLDPDRIAPVLRELDDVEVGFAHGAAEAATAVRDGEAQAAVLLRPVNARTIADWAGRSQRMPPKTTYFFPKPRTGMVFRRL